MPILSEDALEQVVISAVFSDIAQRKGERLQDEMTAGSISSVHTRSGGTSNV